MLVTLSSHHAYYHIHHSTFPYPIHFLKKFPSKSKPLQNSTPLPPSFNYFYKYYSLLSPLFLLLLLQEKEEAALDTVAMLPEEEEQEQEREEEEGKERRRVFTINDNVDLLAEILGHLDGQSLEVAGCVCRLWNAVSRRDSVWEAVCHRHVASGGSTDGAEAGGGTTRSVVAALGGYRRLYRLCIGPALDRLGGGQGAATAAAAQHLSLSLSLSLFSIDCYERLGGRQQRPASLLFLCKPVDVS